MSIPVLGGGGGGCCVVEWGAGETLPSPAAWERGKNGSQDRSCAQWAPGLGTRRQRHGRGPPSPSDRSWRTARRAAQLTALLSLGCVLHRGAAHRTTNRPEGLHMKGKKPVLVSRQAFEQFSPLRTATEVLPSTRAAPEGTPRLHRSGGRVPSSPAGAVHAHGAGHRSPSCREALSCTEPQREERAPASGSPGAPCDLGGGCQCRQPPRKPPAPSEAPSPALRGAKARGSGAGGCTVRDGAESSNSHFLQL